MINQSAVSLTDVSIELSHTEIPNQPELDDKKEANTSVITVEKNDKSESENKTVDQSELTLTIPQVEALLSELKTKHTAEKRLLHCDMMLMKKLIKTMVDKIKEKKKENNKYEIRMIQIKKLQEINKKLKLDNEKLSKENTTLTNGFSKLKILMVQHEYERIQREQEQEWFYE